VPDIALTVPTVESGGDSLPDTLFVLLVYVTLDLSLPAMPGAFVFEPADSVESIQSHGARAALELGMSPALTTESLVLRVPDDVSERWVRRGEVARLMYVVLSCQPRAALDPDARSEDPH
jgi:hypothetical protein